MRFALHVLCGILLSTGCGRRHDLTLHVGGTSSEIATWEDIAAEFEAEAGIHVELLRSTSQTEQRKQSILVALRARQSDPDVLLLDVAWIAQIAASGWLEPLAGLDSTLFFPSVFDHADRWGGTIVGAPVYIDGGILYYRRDLLGKYGAGQPPVTWQDLVQLSRDAMHGERPAHPDFWGYVWQGAEYEGLVCNALEVFVSAGGGFFDEQQRPILDAPQNVRALEMMVDWIHGNRISPPSTYTDMHEDEVRLLFQNGDALFERNWPYAWAAHQAADSPVRGLVGVAPLPHFRGGHSASTLGGWHAAISRYSDRKHEARRFLDYLTSYAVQKKLATELGWNPGRRDVYHDEELILDYPVLPELAAIFQHAVARPNLPYYPEISLVLQKHLNAALAGNVTPAEALRRAQIEVQAVMDEHGS